MRLIDADEFIEYLGLDAENAREENLGEIVTLEDFDMQETSFDLESVISEIEKKLERIRKDQTEDCSKYNGYWTEEQGVRSGMIKAHIEILEILKSALNTVSENGG